MFSVSNYNFAKLVLKFDKTKTTHFKRFKLLNGDLVKKYPWEILYPISYIVTYTPPHIVTYTPLPWYNKVCLRTFNVYIF